MRVREIIFHDFRAFRDRHVVSFVDDLTGDTRPITVIAGTNGTGKTTILEAIAALLMFAIDPANPPDIVREAWESGLIDLTIELTPGDLLQTTQSSNTNTQLELFRIVVGRRLLAPDDDQILHDGTALLYHVLPPGARAKMYTRESPLVKRLRQAVMQMRQGRVPMHGGFIYFPHDRFLSSTPSGPIEPVPEEREWIVRFEAGNAWKGSLEHLWVWQNYLDLEEDDTAKRTNLRPFVEAVENILGTGRRIKIEKGRVSVPPSWSAGDDDAKSVRLDQLPSGERQCILLLGELARRRRPGAVIAIDEPEVSLHPTLQRLIMHRLGTFAREWEAQLIISTHSIEVLHSVREPSVLFLDRLDSPPPESDEIL